MRQCVTGCAYDPFGGQHAHTVPGCGEGEPRMTTRAQDLLARQLTPRETAVHDFYEALLDSGWAISTAVSKTVTTFPGLDPAFVEYLSDKPAPPRTPAPPVTADAYGEELSDAASGLLKVNDDLAYAQVSATVLGHPRAAAVIGSVISDLNRVMGRLTPMLAHAEIGCDLFAVERENTDANGNMPDAVDFACSCGRDWQWRKESAWTLAGDAE